MRCGTCGRKSPSGPPPLGHFLACTTSPRRVSHRTRTAQYASVSDRLYRRLYTPRAPLRSSAFRAVSLRRRAARLPDPRRVPTQSCVPRLLRALPHHAHSSHRRTPADLLLDECLSPTAWVACPCRRRNSRHSAHSRWGKGGRILMAPRRVLPPPPSQPSARPCRTVITSPPHACFTA